jgi:hypothetical protein
MVAMVHFHVAAFVQDLQEELSPPSVKQHLAAIRMLFDWLVTWFWPVFWRSRPPARSRVEAVAMVEVAVGMLVAVAMSLVALPAMASQLTKERTLQRTVGTEVATGAAVPSGGGTEIPIRTTALMSTMTATIPTHKPHRLKWRVPSRPLLPCRRS